MAIIAPPPTYADVVVTDDRTKKSTFNPIWLNWFLELAQTLSAGGSGGGGSIQHNTLGGLQGGSSTERYHLTAAQAGTIASLPSTFVSSFNTRTGTVTLTSSDVTVALGFTPGTGDGTVTSISIVSVNGISGTVANPTTTPAIALSLGAISPTGLITPSSVGIAGSTAGSNAPAGSIGELLSTAASGVALTSNVLANVLSLSLSAGDWEVYGNAVLIPAASTTVQQFASATNTVSATLPGNPYDSIVYGSSSAGFSVSAIPPTNRYNNSSAFTVYLVVVASFAVSTATAGGFLHARRMR